MATPANTNYIPSPDTQQSILQFHQQCILLASSQMKLRNIIRGIDLQYIREMDLTEEQWKARLANVQGDPTKFQNIIMPVIMPQVESAVQYQAEVFLTGKPIFGVTSPAGMENISLQMESIILDQQVRGAWQHQLTLALRDGFKYNLMAAETDWHRIKSFAPDSNNAKEVIWEGNRIKRLDLYNTYWDTRVYPDEISSQAEFVGSIEIMSRIRLKKFLDSLPYNTNVRQAFETGQSSPTSVVNGDSGYRNYYYPLLNPNILVDKETWKSTNWMAWAGMQDDYTGIAYQNMYTVHTLYGRILPSEFRMRGVPGQNTPQVWKFIIVNNEVVVYAERLTNAHDLIPVLFGQPLNDGLAYQTKSLATNVEPIQSISTALANSEIAARRRALSDRIIYDSSKISPAAINTDAPSARIPARPSATGQAVSAFVHQIPFEDSQFQYNQAAIKQFLDLGNMITGQNPARQGQFVKGNKTKYEFDTIMGNATGRDRLTSWTLENTFFAPMKEILKINILQYQQSTSVYNPEQEQVVQVNPIELRTAAFQFKLSDGLVPSERLIDSDVLGQAFQTLAQAPQLGQGYNLTQLFSYLMKSGGADLRPFEKGPNQLAYEQAVQQWSQTVQQAAQTVVQYLSSQKDIQPQQLAQMIQQLQQGLPPQPKPADYNYTPGVTEVSLDGGGQSLLQQVSQILAQQAQAQSGGQVGTGEPDADDGTPGMQLTGRAQQPPTMLGGAQRSY